MLDALHSVVQGLSTSIREKFSPINNASPTHNTEISLRSGKSGTIGNEAKNRPLTCGAVYGKRKSLIQETRPGMSGGKALRRSEMEIVIEPRKSISSSTRVATPRKLFHGNAQKLSYVSKDEDVDVMCLGEFPSVKSKSLAAPVNVTRKAFMSNINNSIEMSENKENQNRKRSGLSSFSRDGEISLSSPVNSRPQKYGWSVYDKIFSFEHPLGVKNDWKKKSTARQSIRLDDRLRYKRLLQETIFSQSIHSFSETRKFMKNLNESSIGEPDKSKTKSAVEGPKNAYPFQGNKLMLQKRSPCEDSLLDKSSTNSVIEDAIRKESEDDSIRIIKVIKHPPRERNSQEIYFRTYEAYNDDWLDNLVKKYETKAKERFRKIEQKRLESDIYRENVEKLHHLLPEQLRKQLSIKESILEETEPEIIEEVFQVTSCMEEAIDKALTSKGDRILSEKFNIQIRRKDIETLMGLNWLNDEIINFYFNLIMERSNTKGLPKVYVFNTFFYPHLSTRGFSSVKRWTRKISLFSYDLILVPVHLEVHWCLGAIDLRKKAIRYYDSMGGNNQKCLRALKSYLEEESLDKRKTPLDGNEYVLEIVKDVPQQMNGSDCGVFTCTYAEFLSRDREITFTQKNMPDIRQRMIYEIITQKLLS